MEDIYCMQCLSYAMCIPCCHYSSLYSRSCIVHAAKHRDQRMHQVVANKRLKQWKIINHQAQKWSYSLTGGCRLLEVPTFKSLTGKILVFWFGGGLSVMGGDRLREVVTNGGSTVLFFDTI